MDKSTFSKVLPTTAPRDHVASGAPLSERRPVPKSRAASKNRNLRARLPFDRMVLLLRGGGRSAPMAQTELHPDWVVGISIGAVNAAIIAGNAPEKRVDRLREFWEEITAPAMGFDTIIARCLDGAGRMKPRIGDLRPEKGRRPRGDCRERAHLVGEPARSFATSKETGEVLTRGR